LVRPLTASEDLGNRDRNALKKKDRKGGKSRGKGGDQKRAGKGLSPQ